MNNHYYLKLDNQYIGNKIISFIPTDDIKQALAVTTINNAIPYMLWECDLSPNYPRLRYIKNNIDRVMVVTHKGTICKKPIDTNYELYALYCARNKEIEASTKLKYMVDNNILKLKDYLLESGVIEKKFRMGDYITDVMYAHSFDIKKKIYTSNTHNYFFIKVVKTDVIFFNQVILPFIKQIDGIYNIVGIHIPTGVRKKQIIRQNKREKIKYHMTHYIDPSPIPERKLEETKNTHNNFSLYEEKPEYKIGDKVYIVRENRKKKNIYIPAIISGIKDNCTYVLNSGSGEKNTVNVSQLVIKCQ
jgi:hypothetical protein